MDAKRGSLSSVRGWLTGIAPKRATLKQDLVAGLPGAISSVPDGMAAGVLAGVNPVHGLYASIFGPVGGGLTASSKLMVITTTSAAALAAGSAVAGVPPDRRSEALFLLTLIAGGLMVVAAVLRLGRFTRFVPHSVMIGFLTGVACNIVLGQLPDLAGSDVSGDFALDKAWNLLLDLGSVDLASLLAGAAAAAILVVLARSRLAPYSALIGLVIPTVAVIALGAASVLRVRDVGHIPQGLPMPGLPHLSELSVSLVSGACAVAALVLIQGAGVSESAPNPDGSRSEPNRDFLAQGVGNLLSGLFRGQPVGGSVGQTALSVAAGARTRWAAIFSGIWMAIILLAFSGIVGAVAMPTLAAVLIVAAVGSLRTGQLRAIMRTSRISQIAVCATFIATLLLPVAAAVGLGVVFALLMQLNREALDLRVVELVPNDSGSFTEQPAAPRLESRRAVLLDVYGSLYYAGARTLQVHLPDPEGSVSPAVVLRLRGRALLGATSYAVLSDYAARIAAVGGRFYLTGLDAEVLAQVQRNRTVENAGDVRLFQATEVIGEASLTAYRHAEEWVSAQN
ncbi:SulP family inorganic anion transporter [Nocardioides sp. HM23]|uniref:SulP family inorganic anion transporter n=1 Tax=Nocardioides bizhenqiangii TaxID=3095076 RepID=UPI002ACA489A|nr:SulP family inorganic anion transporter [Nocardioides sp. HM23]MDZ5623058.1 SulP family inorganic anion transporter [Nocardioides sp. HM23]